MTRLFWLSEEQWVTMEAKLLCNQTDARRVNDQRLISGIVHILKTGCGRCSCPAEHGWPTSIYNHFNRWSRRRFWTSVTETLAAFGAVTKSMALDANYVKEQRAAFSKKGARRRPSAPRAAADDQDAGHHRRDEAAVSPCVDSR